MIALSKLLRFRRSLIPVSTALSSTLLPNRRVSADSSTSNEHTYSQQFQRLSVLTRYGGLFSSRSFCSGIDKLKARRGDWTCPECTFTNFAKNSHCLKCETVAPGNSDFERKSGDWACPKCNFVNFAKNLRCLKCKHTGPSEVAPDFLMKPGDWLCPNCQFPNFANNKKCFRCEELAPKRTLLPGEWECPSCNYVNFRRNLACLRCHIDKPKFRDE